MNVLDIGIFNAIQTMYYLFPPSKFREVEGQVTKAYKELKPGKINCCFLTLQGCYNKILESEVGNTYKAPHINKNKLTKKGKLPETLNVTTEVNIEKLIT